MTSSLKTKALRGAFWSFTERFGLLSVQFIVSILLARLLTPEEFGLVAMVTIFSLLAQLVVTSGFGQALIQKKDCTHMDESTAFWFNIVLGVIMTATLYFSASGIARFYDEPKLVLITQVSAFNLLINSFSVVQNALLQKELLFKKRTIASLSGIVISGAVSIGLALHGFGVWALIIQVLLNNFIRTAMLWLVHPWRPQICFSRDSFSVLFRFGSKLLFSNLLNTVYDNIYLLLIGKIYSAADLGFYYRAKEFILASSMALSQVIAQINFPILSKLQYAPDQMKSAFSQILQHALFIIIPSMIIIGICAPNIISLLLGERWMPSVPYLQLLSIIGALYPLHLLNLNILMALGRSDLLLKLEITKKIIITISILMIFRYGIIALLLAQIVSSVLSLLINSFYSERLLSYGIIKQVNDNAKLLVNGLCIGIVIFTVGHLSAMSVLLTLIIQFAVAVLLFVGIAWLIRDPVFTEWLGRGLAYFRSQKMNI